MLTRATTYVVAALLIFLVVPASPAAADSVVCPPDLNFCILVVATPGGHGTGGATPGAGGGGVPAPTCVTPGSRTSVPCYRADFGWWSNVDGCYYQLASPQPARSEPIWAGHTGGAVYVATCPGAGGSGGGWLWRPTPPPGFGGVGATPAMLAARAVSLLPLRGPVIGMAPQQGKTGLVGLPVWLWTAVSPQTWGPVSATAAVPGVSVTATARVVRVVWQMGDGSSVVCTSPGTPYSIARGDTDSPDCGYRYSRSSAGQPGDVYTVTATATWHIDWAGGGQAGSLTQTRVSTTTVRIGELQVLVS